nr:M23 family metallopeptidase [uncultured Desulfobulbus sp.]
MNTFILHRICSLIFICWASLGLAFAAPPVLQFPVDCQLNHNCYIQNYFDHDPGPGAQDYTCGSLSYDGHRGTDFALPTLKMMEQGVNVLVAASGTVVAVREGEPDISIRERGIEALHGKDAGNGVRIRHQGGWETQYSHMKKGSLRVHRGDKVQAGQVLGQVGLSGNTEFPHLHFSLRHKGRDIDPFAPGKQACGSGQQSFWAKELRKQMEYRPTGLLQAGFSDEKPVRSKVDGGEYTVTRLQTTAPALIFWSVLYGLQKGDRVVLSLEGPSGAALYHKESRAIRNQAMLFAYAGKKRPGIAWPAGRYRGKLLLWRDQAVLLDISRAILIGEQ